jgi:hypothetical protein
MGSAPVVTVESENKVDAAYKKSRHKFFDACARIVYDPVITMSWNDGDCLTDAALYRSEERLDTRVFRAVYGVLPSTVATKGMFTFCPRNLWPVGQAGYSVGELTDESFSLTARLLHYQGPQRLCRAGGHSGCPG